MTRTRPSCSILLLSLLLLANLCSLIVLYGPGNTTAMMGTTETTTLKSSPIKSNDEDSNADILTDSLTTKMTSGATVCERLGSSLEDTWTRWFPTILNNSLPLTDFTRNPRNIRSNQNLTDWLLESSDFFTIPNLMRSILSRSHPSSLVPIVDILNRRLKYQQNTPPNESPPPPPLRILVVGGSVAAGHGCPSNPFGMSLQARKGNIAVTPCAWPARLNDMLDALFGPGVVEISNMAVGGTTSDMSALVLEYGLWPKPAYESAPQGPDVIFWAHAVNDAYVRDHTTIDGRELLLQQFQQSTRKLRCDEHLPVVVYLDDYLGFQEAFPRIWTNLELSVALTRVVTWYRTMGISYTNVVSHAAYVLPDLSERDSNKTVFGAQRVYFNAHPGVLGHVARAWTVLFNLLNGFHDACRPPTSNSKLELSVRHIPPIHTQLNLSTIASEWQSRIQERELECSNPQTQSPCEYVWIASRLTYESEAWKLRRTMAQIQTFNQGWDAQGHPFRKPLLGWIASGPGAVFETVLPVTNMDLRYMTILSMKSYSAKWVNSTLRISIEVISSHKDHAEFTISGYHSDRTSVLIPHKFEIPVAPIGSNLTARFELVGGETFKIGGMGFCSR